MAGVSSGAARVAGLAVKHGRPLHSGPLLEGCCFGGVGVDGGEFLECGAGDADGCEVAAQAAQPSVVATLLKGECF